MISEQTLLRRSIAVTFVIAAIGIGFGVIAGSTATAVALICLVVLPVPIPIIRQALADIFLVTPVELRAEVDAVARKAVETYGFLSHRAYVARMGRGRQIELHFIVPRDQPARRLEEWDDIRNRVSDEIGGEGPDRWLTIAFTTDRDWAE